MSFRFITRDASSQHVTSPHSDTESALSHARARARWRSQYIFTSLRQRSVRCFVPALFVRPQPRQRPSHSLCRPLARSESRTRLLTYTYVHTHAFSSCTVSAIPDAGRLSVRSGTRELLSHPTLFIVSCHRTCVRVCNTSLRFAVMPSQLAEFLFSTILWKYLI